MLRIGTVSDWPTPISSDIKARLGSFLVCKKAHSSKTRLTFFFTLICSTGMNSKEREGLIESAAQQAWLSTVIKAVKESKWNQRPKRDQMKSQPSLVDQPEWIKLIYWSVTFRSACSLFTADQPFYRQSSFSNGQPPKRCFLVRISCRVPQQMIRWTQLRMTRSKRIVPNRDSDFVDSNCLQIHRKREIYPKRNDNHQCWFTKALQRESFSWIKLNFDQVSVRRIKATVKAIVEAIKSINKILSILSIENPKFGPLFQLIKIISLLVRSESGIAMG